MSLPSQILAIILGKTPICEEMRQFFIDSSHGDSETAEAGSLLEAVQALHAGLILKA